MHTASILLSAALLLGFAPRAHADILSYTLTGGNGDGAFTLDTATAASKYTPYGFQATNTNGSGEYFFAEVVGGGLQVNGGSVLRGPMLYTAGASSPTFSTGNFTLQVEGTSEMESLSVVDTTTATPPAPSATPEPSSFVLLGSGLLGMAGVRRRRLRSL